MLWCGTCFKIVRTQVEGGDVTQQLYVDCGMWMVSNQRPIILLTLFLYIFENFLTKRRDNALFFKLWTWSGKRFYQVTVQTYSKNCHSKWKDWKSVSSVTLNLMFIMFNDFKTENQWPIKNYPSLFQFHQHHCSRGLTAL
jgi:hypothetical protein